MDQGKKSSLEQRDFFSYFSKQPLNSVLKKRAVTEISSNLGKTVQSDTDRQKAMKY